MNQFTEGRGEVRDIDTDRLAALSEFNRMLKESEHENALLTDDIFTPMCANREVISFAGEV